MAEADAIEDDSADPQDMVDAENIDGEGDDSEQTPSPNAQRPNPTNLPDPYTVYTSANDEVVKAEELCETEELERLRGYLDGHMAGLSSVIARLANRLQRRLLAQQQRSWTYDLEEGQLDTARLTRIITARSREARSQTSAIEILQIGDAHVEDGRGGGGVGCHA